MKTATTQILRQAQDDSFVASPPFAGFRHVIDGTALRRVCQRAGASSQKSGVRSQNGGGESWSDYLLPAMLALSLIGELALVGALVWTVTR